MIITKQLMFWQCFTPVPEFAPLDVARFVMDRNRQSESDDAHSTSRAAWKQA
jgi:hypothetical protein